MCGSFNGSCHCGSVRFRIDGPLVETTTCDCSLCVMKNARMVKVHESAFTLLSSWDDVSEYRWNTRIARHFFCPQCGIYTFHRKRAQPDHFGVNVFCLRGFDAGAVPMRATEGASMSVVAEDALPLWPGPRIHGQSN